MFSHIYESKMNNQDDGSVLSDSERAREKEKHSLKINYIKIIPN